MGPSEAATLPTAMSSTNLLILRLELVGSVFLIIVGNDEEEQPGGDIIFQTMHAVSDFINHKPEMTQTADECLFHFT